MQNCIIHPTGYRFVKGEGTGLVPLRGFRKFCNYIFRKVDHEEQLQKVMKIVITKIWCCCLTTIVKIVGYCVRLDLHGCASCYVRVFSLKYSNVNNPCGYRGKPEFPCKIKEIICGY